MKITVGLTGKTGAGKSAVSRIFAERGAAVIDGDRVAAGITSQPEILKKLADAFGGDIILDGMLNKKLLARRAFSSPENTDLLNSITHPAINAEMQRLCDEYFKTTDVCVVDAAAIIESGFNKKCDVLITVTAPESVRLERIMKRDGISKADALIRIRAQKSDEWYESKSDYVVINDGANEVETAAKSVVAKIFSMTERN